MTNQRLAERKWWSHTYVLFLQFVIQEMAYHRPVNWQPFLVNTLERYRQAKAQKRLIPMPAHYRHKEEADFYCGTRSLRKMSRSILYLLMSERPADPVQVVFVRAPNIAVRFVFVL